MTRRDESGTVSQDRRQAGPHAAAKAASLSREHSDSIVVPLAVVGYGALMILGVAATCIIAFF